MKASWLGPKPKLFVSMQEKDDTHTNERSYEDSEKILCASEGEELGKIEPASQM